MTLISKKESEKKVKESKKKVKESKKKVKKSKNQDSMDKTNFYLSILPSSPWAVSGM
jgi:hypothetical protein